MSEPLSDVLSAVYWEGQFLMAEERIRTLEAELAEERQRNHKREGDIHARIEQARREEREACQNENHRLLVRDLEREAEVERLREQRDARTEAHAAAEARVRALEAEVARLEAVLDSAKQVIREQDEDLARVREEEREACIDDVMEHSCQTYSECCYCQNEIKNAIRARAQEQP